MKIQPSGQILTVPRTRLNVAPVKVREIVKLIEEAGWYWVRTKDSHHQYKHQTKPGLVTVPGKPGDEVATGTVE